MLEIHSPPDFTTSLLLSVMAMFPSGSIEATSPVENQSCESTCKQIAEHQGRRNLFAADTPEFGHKVYSLDSYCCDAEHKNQRKFDTHWHQLG